MSLQIRFRAIAKCEHVAAAKRYDRERAGLGVEFNRQVAETLAIIASDPQRYPIAEGDVHFASVSGFSYCIYYRVRRGTIRVLAVYHQSRAPGGWLDRI